MTEESRPAPSMDNESRWTSDTKDSDDYYEPYGDGKKWKAINLFRKRDINSIFYLQFCSAIISMTLFDVTFDWYYWQHIGCGVETCTEKRSEIVSSLNPHHHTSSFKFLLLCSLDSSREFGA